MRLILGLKSDAPPPVARSAGPKEILSRSRNYRTREREAPPQEVERHSFAVTHGRVTAGHIQQAGKTFTAISALGAGELGVYHSLKAAADAISDAHGGARLARP